MGLLSRITQGVTTEREPGDDVLLLHGMLIMMGADGFLDHEETVSLETFFLTLPDFRGRSFRDVYDEAVASISRYPDFRDSVERLADLSSPILRLKCYLLAADIALSNGHVDEKEDELLDAMQTVLEISDDDARKILEVLSIKYAES